MGGLTDSQIALLDIIKTNWDPDTIGFEIDIDTYPPLKNMNPPSIIVRNIDIQDPIHEFGDTQRGYTFINALIINAEDKKQKWNMLKRVSKIIYDKSKAPGSGYDRLIWMDARPDDDVRFKPPIWRTIVTVSLEIDDITQFEDSGTA